MESFAKRWTRDLKQIRELTLWRQLIPWSKILNLDQLGQLLGNLRCSLGGKVCGCDTHGG
jgi:hypothetical protein